MTDWSPRTRSPTDAPTLAGAPEEVFIFGIKTVLFTKERLLDTLARSLASERRVEIFHVNLRAVYLYHSNTDFRRSFDGVEAVFIDGMPMVWWGKLLGLPVTRMHRLTYLDWCPDFLNMLALRGRRLAVLGGAPESISLRRNELEKRYPGLSVFIHHGYLNINDNEAQNALLVGLSAFQPDVLMVAMGMPLQEIWISKYRDQLPPCLILPCGAFFDYLIDLIPTPPRVLGRLGLEWLARVIAEPRRLFPRYFLEPFFLIPVACKDAWAAIRGRSYVRSSEDEAEVNREEKR